jgi:hypothetical protein
MEGFPVLPIAPGRKAPPMVKWKLAATADYAAVAERWRQHPVASPTAGSATCTY